MEYDSEVAICLDKEAADKFSKAMSNLNNDENEELYADVLELLTYAEKFIADDDSVLYWWECVKWYDSYASIQFITEFLHSLPDNYEEPCIYRFFIVGEEYGDVGTSGSYYENPFGIEFFQGIHIAETFKLTNKEPQPKPNLPWKMRLTLFWSTFKNAMSIVKLAFKHLI